eukprot:COSAG01_NODE_4254_length_5205_cov_3.427145_5_plen_132_part_00
MECAGDHAHAQGEDETGSRVRAEVIREQVERLLSGAWQPEDDGGAAAAAAAGGSGGGAAPPLSSADQARLIAILRLTGNGEALSLPREWVALEDGLTQAQGGLGPRPGAAYAQRGHRTDPDDYEDFAKGGE